MDFGNRPPPNLGQGITGKAGWNSNQVPLISGDGSSLQRDDVLIPNAGGVLVPKQMAVRVTATELFNSDSTTYVSLTDLTVTINRIGKISFDYYLWYQTSQVTEGIGVRLAFSGTALNVRYGIEAYTDLATRADLVTQTSFGAAVPPFTAGPGGGGALPMVRVTGSANVTVVGDLNLQVRAETGTPQTFTILAGAGGRVWAAD